MSAIKSAVLKADQPSPKLTNVIPHGSSHHRNCSPPLLLDCSPPLLLGGVAVGVGSTSLVDRGVPLVSFTRWERSGYWRMKWTFRSVRQPHHVSAKTADDSFICVSL